MTSPLTRLIAALTVFIVVFVGYGIWYATIAAKSSTVADLENQITAAMVTTSRIASDRATLAKITGDETAVQNYFVPETSVVAFINDLEARGHAEAASVSVVSVSSAEGTAQPTLILALTIHGTFDAVMRTIGAIEYAPYALSISKISARKDPNNTWYADLKLHVGSIPAVATPVPAVSDAVSAPTS